MRWINGYAKSLLPHQQTLNSRSVTALGSQGQLEQGRASRLNHDSFLCGCCAKALSRAIALSPNAPQPPLTYITTHASLLATPSTLLLQRLWRNFCCLGIQHPGCLPPSFGRDLHLLASLYGTPQKIGVLNRFGSLCTTFSKAIVLLRLSAAMP